MVKKLSLEVKQTAVLMVRNGFTCRRVSEIMKQQGINISKSTISRLNRQPQVDKENTRKPIKQQKNEDQNLPYSHMNSLN